MSHPIGAIGFQCMYYQTTETDRHRETQGKHKVNTVMLRVHRASVV